MTRAEFETEFLRAMRFVIQKHDRVNEAHLVLREVGTTHMGEQAYSEAQTNLDAALQQLADHLYDAMRHHAA